MKNNKAFTFPELIVVIIILLVVISLILLSIPKARQNARLKVQAQNMVSDLRLARSMAISEGSSSIDFSDSGYYLIKDSAGGTKSRINYYEGIDITFPSGSRLFVFGQSGAADHGGSFQFAAAGADKRYTVTLTASTGMITLADN